MVAKQVNLRSFFLMVTLIVLWGSSFVVVKVAIAEGLTPISLATFRFLIAGIVLFVILALRKNLKTGLIISIEKKDFPLMLVLAFSGVTFFFLAQYTGITLAGATIASILVCLLSPVLITALSRLLFHEQLRGRQFLGICLAAMGTLTVVGGGLLSIQRDQNFIAGSLILLSTPILWTTYTLLGKKMIEKYSPFIVVSYVTMMGALCLLPFSIAENSLYLLITMNLNSWLAVLYLSILCSLLGYYIWLRVVKEVGATATSSFLFVEPLVTAILAIVLIGEEISFAIALGGTLTFFGVYLTTR